MLKGLPRDRRQVLHAVVSVAAREKRLTRMNAD
jgi:hypothetical protein